MAEETRTYMARSVFNSRSMWLGVATVAAGILALPEVIALIPVRYTPVILSLVGFAVMYLRTQTVRPVTFTAPGSITAVQVEKIDPPSAAISD